MAGGKEVRTNDHAATIVQFRNREAARAEMCIKIKANRRQHRYSPDWQGAVTVLATERVRLFADELLRAK